MKASLEDLRADYLAGNVVPFIGAGLSVAFNIPSWKDLILQLTDKYADEGKPFVKPAIEYNLSMNDYWKAIDDLKHYLLVSEEEIKEDITNLVLDEKKDLTDESLHNYSDLSKMNFKLFLTTNYDNLLQQYLRSDIEPILLKDINFNTQDLFERKRICKLHGTIGNAGSIVISRTSYEELYNDNKYNDLLKLITGTKKILFMGFSFDDQFIRTLIKEHREVFNGNHYIVLSNPKTETVREMKSEYGLKTIDYKTENSSHVCEIRKILEYISVPLEKKTNTPPDSTVLVGAGLKDLQQNFTESTFYNKLQLEGINENLIDLSADFYIAADAYIRQMKKYGNKIEVIDLILGQVFMEYKEKFNESYCLHGNSEVFLNDVHESLKNIDYGRYTKLLKGNQTNKHENRGFIHVLADSENKVWWGEKRFNESKA